MRSGGLIITVGGLFYLIFSLTLASVALSAPPPDTFYVSPSGIDVAGRNGSEGEPWRSISYALSRGEVGGGDIIMVVGDGVEDNDDYLDNVIVDKSVKIYGDLSSTFLPTVKAALSTADVFNVRMNGVEIKNLLIYGADTAAAIELNGVSKCLIEGNYCGLNSSAKNAHGIMVSLGYQNVIKGNFVDHNTNSGITLWQTSGNVVEDNNLTWNKIGIVLIQAGSANVLTFNRIQHSNDAGLKFGASTNQNVATGNVIELGGTGIDLDGMVDGIIAGNTIVNNIEGMYVPASAASNSIFRNQFDNTTNINSTASGYYLGSWSPLFYVYRNYYKSILGNYYSDYSGTDANGDGLGDTPYSTASYRDNQPLVKSADSYILHGFFLARVGGIGRLYINSYSLQGEVVTLHAVHSTIFSFSTPAVARWIFRGGNPSSQTTWTGWLTFASPPPVGHTVEVTFGTSDPGGANFQAVGPVADVVGNDADHILHFTAEKNVFVLPEGKALAVRLTNTGATDLEMMTGGAAAMLFAPAGSRPVVPLQHMFLLLDHSS
ncbi:MAG: right-handed parallel beta-helix repeat-containing protein [Deltaproteobacteria bacterium]|nr:right-handed parallel beta-helix repeat-containing protein [Deltaproteobacteria bacterium]MBW2070584.1 right-handed parallel beta-helix repeat-containing protein [Deltaproteobacteria bacterium]